MVVDHKDHATRCGFRFLAILLEQQGRRSQVIHLAETGFEDLVADVVANVVAIVSAFCERFYGQRRAKRKARPSCES